MPNALQHLFDADPLPHATKLGPEVDSIGVRWKVPCLEIGRVSRRNGRRNCNLVLTDDGYIRC